MTQTQPEKTHCGGCGFAHARTTLELVGPFDDPRDAVRAVGRKRAHVGIDRNGQAVAAGMCCRDAREAAGPGGRSRWAEDLTEEQLDAEAAAEEYGERMFASSYGLGL